MWHFGQMLSELIMRFIRAVWLVFANWIGGDTAATANGRAHGAEETESTDPWIRVSAVRALFVLCCRRDAVGTHRVGAGESARDRRRGRRHRLQHALLLLTFKRQQAQWTMPQSFCVP